MPPRGQDAAHRGDAERHGQALERALPAVAEADELVAVLADALADDGPDDRVEAGAVAAAGEDSDAHAYCSSLVQRRGWPDDAAGTERPTAVRPGSPIHRSGAAVRPAQPRAGR